MKRRDLIATALTAPHLLLAGCASPASPSSSGSPAAAKAQITVLYDAFGRDPALQKDWGYAAFVEVGGKRILFDTGNNAEVLAKNAAAKSVDLVASRLRRDVASPRRPYGRHELPAQRQPEGQDLRAQGRLRRLWRRPAEHLLSQGRVAAGRAALLRRQAARA